MSVTAVRILLFATMRRAAGCAVAEVEVPSQGGSVEWCWEALCRQHPDLSRHRETVRPALNRSYVGWDQVVVGGDELAFIPPVSGGAG